MGFNKKGYWFKCLEHSEHHSELKNIVSFIGKQSGNIICNQCNSFAQYLIDMFGENAIPDYWDSKKNNELGLDPWEISYGSNKKIYIFCQNEDKLYHESYDIRCADFVNGDRCPFCSGKRIHYLDSLGFLFPQVIPIWSEKNKKTSFEYSPFCSQEVYWKCPYEKHENYRRSISSSNACDFRCPKCVQERDESFLQEKVRLYLKSLGYTILHERNCTILPKNPKSKDKRGQLPFDNEIKELRLIVEVMGLQHYEMVGYNTQTAKKNNTTPKYELHYVQLKDRYKKFISFKQGYNYIAIPYWTDNNSEDWKTLIDNKIKEILEINKIKGDIL